MENSKKLAALVAAAAIGGVLTGSAIAQDSGANKEGLKIAKKAGKKATEPKEAAHDCAGKNSCKGKGGCKTGDSGCKGKNSCKGKGGCKTH